MIESEHSGEKIGGRILLTVLLAVSAVYAVLVFLKPVYDPDLWWHLATGKHIVATKALPTRDPFTFTTPAVIGEGGRFILNSYWLSQIVFYAASAVAGLKGVILLRATILSLLFFVVFHRLRKLAIPPLLSAVMLATSLLSLGAIYQSERPQTLTFLFAAVLLGMMEAIRSGRKPSFLLVPLMIVWANSHGGFIIGDILLASFAAGALLQYRKEPAKAGAIGLWAFSGIAASLVNPNFAKAFTVTMNMMESGNTSRQFIIEFGTTFEAFFNGSYHVAILWIMLALTLAGMLVSKERYWPDIFILAVSAYLTLFFVRNVAIFTVCSAPLCAWYLHRSQQKGGFTGWPMAAKAGVVGALAIVITSSAAAHVRQGSPLRIDFSRYYPAGAAGFITKANLAGNMFNDYDWGGFLIWTLYPQHRVFIDGRVTDPAVLTDYITITKASRATAGNRAEYRQLLEKYQVAFVIQRLHQRSGILNPLMKHLLNDPEWVPVYLDETGYIMVKNQPLNRPVLDRYAIGKLEFTRRLLEVFDREQGADPDYIPARIAKSEMLAYLGKHREAEQELLAARKIDPGNREIKKSLESRR